VGARIVIVMLDNRQHVPACTSTTREKRGHEVTVPDLGENELLGRVVPANFDVLIANRRFALEAKF
jgi:hypothetical protein